MTATTEPVLLEWGTPFGFHYGREYYELSLWRDQTKIQPTELVLARVDKPDSITEERVKAVLMRLKIGKDFKGLNARQRDDLRRLIHCDHEGSTDERVMVDLFFEP